jgi:membrane protein DedA with SNARE-associated domain
MSGLLVWAQHLPASGLYAFILAWLVVESTGFPNSDEPLLLLAGYLGHRGQLNLVAAIAVALAGKVAASCVAFWLGRRIDLLCLARPAVRPAALGFERWMYYLRPTTAFVHGVERWSRTRGVWGVFFGRLIPVVRSFISYPAGATRMPFERFLVATTTGALIWITTWTLLGAALGKLYEAAAHRWGSLSWLMLAAFVAMLAGV